MKSYIIKYSGVNKSFIIGNDSELIGGEIPTVDILRDMNWFEENSDIEKFLNPIYGFLWFELNCIDNYYKFGNKKKDSIAKLVGKTFWIIRGEHRTSLTNKLKELTPYDIGHYLGFKYFLKINNLRKIKECIKKTKNIISDLESHKKRLDQISKFDKQSKPTEKQKQILENMKENAIKYDKIIKNEIKTNFSSIKSDIPEINKYIEEISTHTEIILNPKEIIDILNIYISELEYHITEKPIFNEIIKKYFFEYLDDDQDEIYYVILSILWWKLTDKGGIEEYYKGINEYFKVSKPKDFGQVLHVFKIGDLPPRKYLFEKKLIEFYRLYKNIISLPGQDYTNILNSNPNLDYPDCGETTLRNFIRIISYNNGSYNLDILKKLEANDNLLEFFTVFNTDQLQISDKPLFIYNQNLTVRDAWGYIVSNLDNIRYANNNKHGKYELCDKATNDGTNNNILAVLQHLFRKINKWDDFNQIPNVTITNHLHLEKHIGTIDITVTNFGTFIWSFQDGHFEMSEKKNNSHNANINESFNEKEQFYLSVFKIDYHFFSRATNDQYNTLYNGHSKWYNFIDFENPAILIKIINDNYKLEDNIFKEDNNNQYNNIILYIIKNYDDDKMSRIKFNLNKMYPETQNKYYNRAYDVSYATQNKTVDNLQKIEIFIDKKKHNLTQKQLPSSLKDFNSLYHLDIDASNDNLTHIILKTIPNLKILKLRLPYDTDIKILYNDLVNLEELTLNYKSKKIPKFITELDNSLFKLSKLKSLTLGKYFNTDLNKSLEKLTQLEFLTLGDSFSKNIDNDNIVISNLTQLKELHLGVSSKNSFNILPNNLSHLTISYDITLNNYLNKSTKLTHLSFGNKYNSSLGNSLNSLINLTHLSFGNDYNLLLGDSLNLLINLTHLSFGNDYNLLLGDSLNLLINLTHLSFGEMFNQPLNGSFVYLKNLESIYFGKYFNQSLGPSELQESRKLKKIAFPKDYNLYKEEIETGDLIIYKEHIDDSGDWEDFDFEKNEFNLKINIMGIIAPQLVIEYLD